MIWIIINTFFAVVLLVGGITEYIKVADKTIGEIGGPKLVTILAMIALGCALHTFSLYAIVQMALAAKPG